MVRGKKKHWVTSAERLGLTDDPDVDGIVFSTKFKKANAHSSKTSQPSPKAVTADEEISSITDIAVLPVAFGFLLDDDGTSKTLAQVAAEKWAAAEKKVETVHQCLRDTDMSVNEPPSDEAQKKRRRLTNDSKPGYATKACAECRRAKRQCAPTTPGQPCERCASFTPPLICRFVQSMQGRRNDLLLNPSKPPSSSSSPSLTQKRKRQESLHHYPIGTTISKTFFSEDDGRKRPFRGEVIKYDMNKCVYLIRYEDNDHEEMTEKVLREFVVEGNC